jgi:ribosomal protein S12 methylthiotransferase
MKTLLNIAKKRDISPKKIGFLSLGCPRNLVDTEVMLGIIKKAGWRVEEDINNSDIAVINTCGFIKDAKEESIEAILKVARLKKEGMLKALIVTGCLSERYKEELGKELPEVDAFLGTGNFSDIAEVIKKLPLNGNRVKTVPVLTGTSNFINPVRNGVPGRGISNWIYDHKSPRLLLTPPHYAYTKISEGCRNNCSYCVIKEIRGDFRSRPSPSIIAELKKLSAEKPLKEIILIGQDTTLYGADLYKAPSICKLLKEVCSLGAFKWVRLLYTHPAHIQDCLIDLMRNEPSLCKYIDLPIQHINDNVLKRMNRGVTKKEIIRIIGKLKKHIPDIAIRTSLIVGFPGETEQEFEELLDFVKEIEFDRLGVFLYSREEGTPAYSFECQIPERVKKERFNLIMKAQQEVSMRNNARFLGKTLEVLIDEKDKSDPNLFIGRTEFDAPEVDGIVYIKSKIPACQGKTAGRKNQKSKFKTQHRTQNTEPKLKVGEFVRVKIIDTLEYDLVGILV